VRLHGADAVGEGAGLRIPLHLGQKHRFPMRVLAVHAISPPGV
jgi:hypothetical protein